MSWTHVPAGEFKSVARLEEGQCTLTRSGAATFRLGDLALIGVSDRVSVFVDQANFRIGFKRPTEVDLDGAYRVSIARAFSNAKRSQANADTGRRTVNIGRALKLLGVDPRVVAGRYDLSCKDDAILILSLGDLSAEDRELARPKPPKPWRSPAQLKAQAMQARDSRAAKIAAVADAAEEQAIDEDAIADLVDGAD